MRPADAADRRAVGAGPRAPLSTTQRYLNPVTEDVIAGVLAFHARQRDHDPAAAPAVGYRVESLQILFGENES